MGASKQIIISLKDPVRLKKADINRQLSNILDSCLFSVIVLILHTGTLPPRFPQYFS